MRSTLKCVYEHTRPVNSQTASIIYLLFNKIMESFFPRGQNVCSIIYCIIHRQVSRSHVPPISNCSTFHILKLHQKTRMLTEFNDRRLARGEEQEQYNVHDTTEG